MAAPSGVLDFRRPGDPAEISNAEMRRRILEHYQALGAPLTHPAPKAVVAAIVAARVPGEPDGPQQVSLL
jgi:hypothetical protein